MRAIRLPDGRLPVLLSAHAEELIGTDAAAIGRYLDRAGHAGVAEVAAQLIRTRRIRRYRTVIRAADRTELADGLRAVAAGTEHPMVARSCDAAGARVAFVFPGQGTQWAGMGAEAYAQLPAYAAAADECAANFVAAGLSSPLSYLTAGADSSDRYTEIEVEGAQFAHHVALAGVWRSCGVLPDVTIGHSLGEIAAAYIAGAMTLVDAVAVVAARAGVVDRLSGRYAVAALGIGVAEAHNLIAETPGWLELSVVNAEASIAVSGDRDAVLAAVRTVQARGRFGREITVNFPVHTSVLEPLRDELRAAVPPGEFAGTAVRFIGGATGDVVPAGTPFADYWYRNLRDMVRFDRAVESATRCGVSVFAEMSAHPSLLFAIQQVLGDRPAVLVGSGRRGESLAVQLSTNIAGAAVALPDYGFGPPAANSEMPLRGFPNAPMRALPMWAAPAPPSSAPGLTAPGLTVAVETWCAEPITAPTVARRVAVLDLGPDGVGRAVHAALDRHGVATLADPAEADLLVVVAPGPAPAAGAVDEVSALAGAGLFGYVDAIGPRCRDVWLVTVGSEQTGPGDPAPSPTQSGLAAMHRSIGFEHPDQAFGHLDLPRGPLTETAADTVVEVLLTGTGEMALRGPVALHRTLTDAPPTNPWPLDSGLLDNVIITGGAGAIGMHYVQHLAARGAKRIVLLSRRGADPGELTALASHHGTEIVSVRCDITDAAAVAAAAVDHAGEGASLLIHAAGTAGFDTRDALSAAGVADTLRAKVDGLTSVVEHWPLRPESRILLCSSVIGVWGGKGAAAYAAANRMLDAQAADLRARGHRCTSMRWGLWQGFTGAMGQSTGIVDAAESARVQRTGLRPMPPDVAIEASLRDHPSDPLVLSADPGRLQMFLGAHQDRPATDGDADTARAVTTHLAAVLNVADPALLDIDASLFDLGVDSLLALDLRKRLKRTVGRTVPLAKLLGGITGTDLIAELTTEERRESPRDAAL